MALRNKLLTRMCRENNANDEN